MKNLTLYIFIQFLISHASILQAQWVQTNGPGHAYVLCIASNGTNVFAGTTAGVSLSTNNGINWIRAAMSWNSCRDLSAQITGKLAEIADQHGDDGLAIHRC